MGLLVKAEKQTAYLKAGILGFAGSGKTYTASSIAIGLQKRLGGKRPTAFFDTETGADYMIDRFKKEGLELEVARTRAFSDLLAVVEEAEQSCDVLIIDSISHVWQELLEAYQKKHNLRRLAFHHWGPIKGEWRRFTDAYLTSRLHIIMCGRAAWEYEYEGEGDSKELLKTGTKMRAETEMSFEPSLLLEMVREPSEKKRGSTWTHKCYVLKDRAALINGRCFENPSFTDFEPVINALNIGGSHQILDTSRHTDIAGPDYSTEDRRRLQQIYAEEIEGLLVSEFPGQTKEEKKAKADILQVVFDSRSWTAITQKHPDELKFGALLVKELCQAFRQNRGSFDPNNFDLVAWLSEQRDEILEAYRRESDDNIPDFEMGARN